MGKRNATKVTVTKAAEAITEYMGRMMDMHKTDSDQEQNWIAGHMHALLCEQLAAKDKLIEAMIAHVDERAIEWSVLSSAKALWMARIAEDIASRLRAMVEAAKPAADFAQRVHDLSALAESIPPEIRATSAVREVILGDVKEPAGGACGLRREP